MEMWTEVRRRVLTGELSKRAACQKYGINWRTLMKMLAHAEPPGYRRKVQREKPVVGSYLDWIHEVLEHDKQEPVKQRHTAPSGAPEVAWPSSGPCPRTSFAKGVRLLADTQPSADIRHVHALPKIHIRLPKQAHDLLCAASLLHLRTLSSPHPGTRLLSQDLEQDLGRGSLGRRTIELAAGGSRLSAAPRETRS
jgi:hypothetical protein